MLEKYFDLSINVDMYLNAFPMFIKIRLPQFDLLFFSLVRLKRRSNELMMIR